MSYYEFDEDEEGNVLEIEEQFDAPSSRKISNSIHNFSEIMYGSNSGIPSERFSGNYHPRRRKLLTETNQDNIDTAKFKNPSQKFLHRESSDQEEKRNQNRNLKEYGRNYGDEENNVFENRNKIIPSPTENVNEENFEEDDSNYQSHHQDTIYEEADTYSAQPSTQKETSNKKRNNEEQVNEIVEDFGSEENKSIINSNIMEKANEEMEKAFKQIEYECINKSIQQRKWINRSVMEKRDITRMQDYRRRNAQNSLKREFQELEEFRSHNKIHINKKSRKLAQKALKRKIKTVVDNYAQNGYMAFEHYLHVLYVLHITQNLGKLDDEFHQSARIRKAKEKQENDELEFSLQLWNKINCYLFNYVD